MNIKTIMQENPEGFTIDCAKNALIKSSDGYTGYLIGISDNESSLKDAEQDYKRLLVAASLINNPCFIGGWKDTTTGKYYLDLSIRVDHHQTARLLKELFGQAAIFSLDAWESF